MVTPDFHHDKTVLMRPLWTGSISFGLINIPVKIYSAIQESSLDLTMLDKKDHANIKFKRVNENTGKEVNFKDIVKGFKLDDDYVVLDDKDFETAGAEKTKTIDIQSFVDEKEIESLYYEQPYYLEPDKTGVKAYALLRDALAAQNKVGVTTFVMRNKELLAVLKPYKNAIVLNRIHFNEEIRDLEDLKLPPVTKDKAKDKELQMATKLVEQLTDKFNPEQYKDTYREKLMKVIHDKAKGRKPKAGTKLKVVHSNKEQDLMQMLKASLDKKKKAS